MIDVSDIRYVKFTDCEDPIIDIKVSDAKQVVYPIIVWREGEGKIYRTSHDRNGKNEYQVTTGSGNVQGNKLNLVNKQKRYLTGSEILAIVEKTGNKLYGINQVEEYNLKSASPDSKVEWLFEFKSKSRSLHLSPDNIDLYLFYFDENGDRAAFHIYE